MAGILEEEERVVVVDVTVEEEKTPVEREEFIKLEWPEMAALGTIVVTNTSLLPTCRR